jgi:hypothetical protein
MWETSGVLRPVIEGYLNHEPMSPDHIIIMRAYLRQWIRATIWDRNPHAGAKEKAWLAGMRDDVDELTSHAAITRWLRLAEEQGLDPM